MQNTEWKSAVRRASDLVGGQTRLSGAIGKSPRYVSWLIHYANKPLKAEVAVAIEGATDGLVTRHDLRPDLFGSPPQHTEPRHEPL